MLPYTHGSTPLLNKQLEADVPADNQHRLRPALGMAERHEDRQRGRNPRPDVGDKPQRKTEHAPQHCARHTDQPQPQADGQAVAGVHEKLHPQQAADAAAGIVHGLGCGVQVRRAEELQQTVALVLAIEQDKKHEHHDDADRTEWREHRAEPVSDPRER